MNADSMQSDEDEESDFMLRSGIGVIVGFTGLP